MEQSQELKPVQPQPNIEEKKLSPINFTDEEQKDAPVWLEIQQQLASLANQENFLSKTATNIYKLYEILAKKPKNFQQDIVMNAALISSEIQKETPPDRETRYFSKHFSNLSKNEDQLLILALSQFQLLSQIQPFFHLLENLQNPEKYITTKDIMDISANINKHINDANNKESEFWIYSNIFTWLMRYKNELENIFQKTLSGKNLDTAKQFLKTAVEYFEFLSKTLKNCNEVTNKFSNISNKFSSDFQESIKKTETNFNIIQDGAKTIKNFSKPANETSFLNIFTETKEIYDPWKNPILSQQKLFSTCRTRLTHEKLRDQKVFNINIPETPPAKEELSLTSESDTSKSEKPAENPPIAEKNLAEITVTNTSPTQVVPPATSNAPAQTPTPQHPVTSPRSQRPLSDPSKGIRTLPPKIDTTNDELQKKLDRQKSKMLNTENLTTQTSAPQNQTTVTSPRPTQEVKQNTPLSPRPQTHARSTQRQTLPPNFITNPNEFAEKLKRQESKILNTENLTAQTSAPQNQTLVTSPRPTQQPIKPPPVTRVSTNQVGSQVKPAETVATVTSPRPSQPLTRGSISTPHNIETPPVQKVPEISSKDTSSEKQLLTSTSSVSALANKFTQFQLEQSSSTQAQRTPRQLPKIPPIPTTGSLVSPRPIEQQSISSSPPPNTTQTQFGPVEGRGRWHDDVPHPITEGTKKEIKFHNKLSSIVSPPPPSDVPVPPLNIQVSGTTSLDSARSIDNVPPPSDVPPPADTPDKKEEKTLFYKPVSNTPNIHTMYGTQGTAITQATQQTSLNDLSHFIISVFGDPNASHNMPGQRPTITINSQGVVTITYKQRGLINTHTTTGTISTQNVFINLSIPKNTTFCKNSYVFCNNQFSYIQSDGELKHIPIDDLNKFSAAIDELKSGYGHLVDEDTIQLSLAAINKLIAEHTGKKEMEIILPSPNKLWEFITANADWKNYKIDIKEIYNELVQKYNKEYPTNKIVLSRDFNNQINTIDKIIQSQQNTQLVEEKKGFFANLLNL